MDNIKWKGIFQFKDTMFFAQNNSTRVSISDGLKCVRKYSKENVSGCAYNDETLWLSIENSNTLIAVDSENNEELIPILDYDNINIIKMVTGQEAILVLEGSNAEDKSLFVFDCRAEKVLFVLPIKEHFIDIVITSYKTALLLCEEGRRVPARYSDEVDDEEVLFWAELTWNKDSTEVTIKKAMKLYIDYNYETDAGNHMQTILYSEGLCFPLFDQYLYHWLEQKSFSLNGKYVVYYSEDIRGIVIGNPVGGEIYRIIALPDDVADAKNEFFYNYHASELVVITKDNEIKRFVIKCTSEAALNSLNTAYNEAFLNKISLFAKRNKGDMTFTNILYRAIGNCVCMPAGIVRSVNKSDDGITHVNLTIKTPISGKIILKQTQKVLSRFECQEEEFEKTIQFDVTEDIFGVVFKTDCLEKEFFFSIHTHESLYIDIEEHLTFNEIAQCCNRISARRKLQTYPTDIYATFQLGYVGTEEDYNFLLSILEDDYSGSSLSHGNNGERVWMCVRTISNLSFRYRRKDAIPFLIEACKHIEDKKVLEMVQDCCASLKSCNSFSEKQYRVDLLVRTNKVVHIFDNSKDKWIAKIDGTLGYDERIDWCYLRASAKQIKLIFETSLGNKEVMIDVGDNNPQYRQVIDIEIPVFSRDMAKRILNARGDRVLVIPEGITELADDFALQFDERNNKYYFFQIDIPASVSKIDAVILTEKPGWASDDRLECFDEINVADDNLVFRSIDGVLFSKDMKRLICYPCGKKEEIYLIPNGVEIIAPNAFSDNHFLKSISLPPSLIKIDSMAFDSCENLNCVNFSEGLEVIADDAFIFCDVTHMILPNSLRKIHWTNLIGIGVGIRNMEVPNSKIDIDMTDYHECNQEFYMPPLLLIQENQTFEKFAHRYKMNSIKGYYIDESGIIWSEDGITIIEFPVEWYDEEYRLPEKTTGIFRWAFNCSSVKRVIASKTPRLVGRTQGDDFSRLDIDSGSSEFLVITNNETVSMPSMLDIQKEHRKGEKDMKIRVPHFKIGITFSGKYRKQFIEPFCNELLKLGYNKDDIFYDSWHDVLINGVHGDSILRQIYFKNCDCVVVLLSPDYKEKNWTGHIEWSAVKELINMGYDDKICLLRVDSVDIGKIDGLYQNQAIAKTIDDMSAVEIATFVHQKYNMLI